MRMLAIYHKTELARFVSHLDVQRTLQRAFRRAKLPLAYSEGFNPHPQCSFASALSTGATSDAEWFEVELTDEMSPERFLNDVNAVMPKGFYLSDAQTMPAGIKTLSLMTRGAQYDVKITADGEIELEEWKTALDSLLSGEIIVDKRTKGGIKPVDIRPQILKASAERTEGKTCFLSVLGRLQADGGLRIELFAGALLDRLAATGSVRFHRTAMYFDPDGSLPRIPSE